MEFMQEEFHPVPKLEKIIFTFRQSLLAFVGFLQSAAVGSLYGFTSVLLAQLNETQDIILTVDQTSWIAAILPLIMIPTVLATGWVLRKIGRHLTVAIVEILTFLAWILTYYANSYATLLSCRIMGGVFAGTGYPALIAYVGEITHPRLRAVCLALIPLGAAAGVLLTQLFGMYLPWRTLAALNLIIPSLNLIVLYYISESYIWLLNKNRRDDARRAFIWYRGYDDEAMKEFTVALVSRDDILTIESSVKETIRACFRKSFIMPLLLTALLFLTSEFSGDTALIFYTSHIIKIITNDPEVQFYANLILNILRVVATMASVILIKRFSIRIVFVVTSFAVVCSLANISIFLYLLRAYPENEVFPIICVISVILNVIFFALGLGPLPSVICGEIYPTTLRDIGSALSAFLAFCSLFIIVKTMPYLFVLLRPEFIFLIFACCTCVGSTIMYFVLPNTKNRTLKDLEHFYKK